MPVAEEISFADSLFRKRSLKSQRGLRLDDEQYGEQNSCHERLRMGGKRVFAVGLVISSIDGKVGARLQRSLFRDAVVDLCAVHAKCAVIVKKQASESQERSSVQSSRIQELRIRVDVDGSLGWRVQAVDRSHVPLERGDQGVGRDRDGVHGEASLAGDG